MERILKQPHQKGVISIRANIMPPGSVRVMSYYNVEIIYFFVLKGQKKCFRAPLGGENGQFSDGRGRFLESLILLNPGGEICTSPPIGKGFLILFQGRTKPFDLLDEAFNFEVVASSFE